MKNIRLYKKILYIFLFAILFILIGTVKSKAGNLKLNNLDFEVQINSNGSMDVTETWDIRINDTNTLYKEFKTDSSKYSGITNVSVKEITNGENKYFSKINDWAYHAPKDSYFGAYNSKGNFEIGWGVGLENKTSTRKYEISYTVKDAITKYNDYAELYWQFIGEDFEVDAKKITGTIYLPSNVSNLDDIKVWAHSEDLNGTIYATGLNKIEFEMNDFRNGRYVEIRTLFPRSLIYSSGRTRYSDILQTAIAEETQWSEEANIRRAEREKETRIIAITFISIYTIVNVIAGIIFGRKIGKYSEIKKELNKNEPTQKLEYYRDLPEKDATPGEAINILNPDICINKYMPSVFGKVFSATMLDLALKGYLELQQEKNGRKDKITINILKSAVNDLKEDEKHILEYVIKAAKGNNTLTLDELKKYMEKHPSSTESLIKDNYNKTNKQLIEAQIVNKDEQKEYEKFKEKESLYGFGIFMFLCFACVIPGILCIINAILCGKIAKNLNVLSQKGVDMHEQWNGLKKYMEDFSLLNEREVPELVIWEKYLVYATAFGIADKVIKQLKVVYPNFEEMSDGFTTYTYMNIMMNTDFSSSLSSSISSSISSAYSSGSGGGGGFSGRRRRRRRPEVAEAGR